MSSVQRLRPGGLTFLALRSAGLPAGAFGIRCRIGPAAPAWRPRAFRTPPAASRGALGWSAGEGGCDRDGVARRAVDDVVTGGGRGTIACTSTEPISQPPSEQRAVPFRVGGDCPRRPRPGRSQSARRRSAAIPVAGNRDGRLGRAVDRRAPRAWDRRQSWRSVRWAVAVNGRTRRRRVDTSWPCEVVGVLGRAVRRRAGPVTTEREGGEGARLAVERQVGAPGSGVVGHRRVDTRVIEAKTLAPPPTIQPCRRCRRWSESTRPSSGPTGKPPAATDLAVASCSTRPAADRCRDARAAVVGGHAGRSSSSGVPPGRPDRARSTRRCRSSARSGRTRQPRRSPPRSPRPPAAGPLALVPRWRRFPRCAAPSHRRRRASRLAGRRWRPSRVVADREHRLGAELASGNCRPQRAGT